MTTQAQLLTQAIAEGVLPPEARNREADISPSWVVMTLGYLGALLVALLGLGVLALFSWGAIFKMPGSLITCLVLTAAGMVLLRAGQSLFRQQLGFSILLIGQVMWLVSWGLRWELTARIGISLPLLGLLALQLLSAWMTPAIWVVRLLGMLAAWTFLATPLGASHGRDAFDALAWSTALGINLWALALVWALWCALQVRLSPRRWALRASALMDGVAITLLLQPLVEYGMGRVGLGSARFLMPTAGDSAPALFHFNAAIAIRMVLVGAAALWLLHTRWSASAYPELRRSWPLFGLLYAALLLACWFTPVEAIAVVATMALGTGRRRLLLLALAALLVQLSNFYYLLTWSLMQKAWVLWAAGFVIACVLVAVRLLGGHAKATATQPQATAPVPTLCQRKGWRASAIVIATAALAVGLVQWDVSGKERVIAQGQKIFVRLAPVDPRSLMQGDYMALRFDLPPAVHQQLAALSDRSLGATRHVVAKIDHQGVAQVLRLFAPNEHLPSGERLLPLRYLKGHWVLVTDAYFFPEGQGQYFNAARYGEFRALPGGEALLVGLADEKLQPIKPQAGKDIPQEPTPTGQESAR